MDITVLAIIGTGYSGSTLVQKTLSRDSRVLAAGEILRLRAVNAKEAFVPESLLLEGCDLCHSHGCSCPVWTDSLLASVAGPEVETYRAIALSTNTSIIVDGSKSTFWYLRLLQSMEATSSADIRIIFLNTVRHPVAYAYSLYRRGLGSLESGVAEWVRVQSDVFRVVNFPSQSRPMLVVNYDKFAPEPARSAERLMLNVGLPYLPLDEVPAVNKHYLGGNIGVKGTLLGENVNWSGALLDSKKRYEGIEHRVDGDWRHAVPGPQVEYLISLPFVRDLSSMLGITL